MNKLLSSSRNALFGVALLTAVGLLLRLLRYDQSVFGDELSTLFIVKNRSLGDVLSDVSSDAEISPPLYFVLAWLTTKLGSAAELVRLPSLIAGTASIPLVYAVGVKALRRPAAGLVAAAFLALSPFMILYSTDGRGYAVAIALLLLSTLSMLIAVDTGRTRWWVAFGAFTFLAMLTHYTAAFVLIAQLLWLLWASPPSRRAGLAATTVAAIAYIPWVPSLLADMDSPTMQILNALQGSGFGIKRAAVETWMFGYPYADLHEVPGHVFLALGFLGLLGAGIAGLVRFFRGSGRTVDRGVVLVIAIAVATPAAEAVLLLVGGTDLFSARNLTVSSGGLALTAGALLTSAGVLWGTVCGIAVFACLGVGAARIYRTDSTMIDFKGVASRIESEAMPGDVVIDLVTATPVPLTPLDADLAQRYPEYRVFLPLGPPPFLAYSAVTDPDVLIRLGFEQADGHRVLLVGTESRLTQEGNRLTSIETKSPLSPTSTQVSIPNGWKVTEETSFPGLLDIQLLVLEQVKTEKP